MGRTAVGQWGQQPSPRKEDVMQTSLQNGKATMSYCIAQGIIVTIL